MSVSIWLKNEGARYGWVFFAIGLSWPVAETVAETVVPSEITCDVCIVGGGSSGFGAALAAARAGSRVVVVEKQRQLGGASTSGYVSNWEPGPGGTFAKELYTRGVQEPRSVAVARYHHSYQATEPYAIVLGSQQDPLTYDDTLQRTGIPREQWHSLVWKPEELANVMRVMLQEAGVRILLETSFEDAVVQNGHLVRISCQLKDSRKIIIAAKVFVDATGDAYLCRKVGCETYWGTDPRRRFGEPSAPDEVTPPFLNAISLCYRIQKVPAPKATPKPSVEVGGFGKTAFVFGLSEEELIVNPLPLVPGKQLIEDGYNQTFELAMQRVEAHWAWLHQYPHFRNYERVDVAPLLGIRESYRVVADYTLTEMDVRGGLSQQKHNDLVAIADHALDIHGSSHGAKELTGPYGIPYRCLIPKGRTNLLVVGRCAGFSHIAASSCRLSRTMMALGHAGGVAAAEAAAKSGDVRAVDISRLVTKMGVMKHISTTALQTSPQGGAEGVKKQ